MDPALPRYNRKTTLRVKLTDKLAGAGIRVGGLGVIVAVVGLIVFIGWQVIPLFADSETGVASEPFEVTQDKVLLVHTDEYRRVGFSIDESGQITTFSVASGDILSRFKPAEIGDATLAAAHLSLRPRTKRKVGSILDVPHHHLLLGTSSGEVWVCELGYLSTFLDFEVGKEPAYLAGLTRPEEEEYKSPHYRPGVVVHEGRVIEHVPTFGLYRTTEPLFSVQRKLAFKGGGAAIRLIAGQVNSALDTEDRESTTIIVTDDGKTLLAQEKVAVNPLDGRMKASCRTKDLTAELPQPPDFALVNELQDEIVLARGDGTMHHYGRPTLKKPFALLYPAFSVFAEQADEHGRPWRQLIDAQREDYGHEPIRDELRVTALAYLLGDSSVMIGDNRGGVQCWFGVIEGGEGESRLARIRSLEPARGAVSTIKASPITKAALVLDESGDIRAINNTAERVYARFELPGAQAATFNRKGDGVLTLGSDGRLHHWWIDAPHSEVSLKSLFGQVWYEDYAELEYEWQSTGGTDDVEPKLSLVPLVAGTIKGAIYALIFAIPLGVLAAIYTSEFMHRNMRSILKPTMEVMASLPSVVLGFLAALYFAPLAAPMMPTLIVAIVIVPGVFMVFGWLWQRCPPSVVGRFGYWSSTALLFALLALGILISSVVGPRAESHLFPAVEGASPAQLDPVTFAPLNEETADALSAGDFRTWTGGGQLLPRPTEHAGRVVPKGWWNPGGHNLLVACLAIPFALLLGVGVRRAAGLLPKRDGMNLIESLRMRLEGNRASMRGVAVDAAFSLVLAVGLLAAGYLLATLLAPAFEWAFFSYDHPTAGRVADFRRAVTGEKGWKFEQTNSLVVGFCMGFAVIPIIYTISEDALTSVPNQLRAASLACGASRWQTTTRVVLPAAASGIFSAIVIGLGRALGETMIVVMAAGGTPVMEMQPLNGFRSLSAAIAIEMPEAPHGGSLYRTLFLGGLLLFCMAFLINTVAEVVRMRLRRRLSRM